MPRMAQRDYYDVLGIDKTATQDEIKSAYRRLARKYHPDVNKAKDSVDKFKEATAAYEVISDPEKRKLYDQFGFAGPQGFGQAGPSAGRPGGRGPGGRTYTYTGGQGGQGVNFEDMFANSPFAGMSLEELLSNLGGYGRRAGGRRGRAAQAPREEAPAEAQTSISLDFMQAIRGCTTTLQLASPDGSVEQIDVKIPPGVHEGSKIRVRGKHGHALAGDLYITVHVREHPYFRREGSDILVEAPISITEAGLGGEVTVPTIDGAATVKTPPGASSGTKLRLRGKGVSDPRTGQRGDQYVVLKVVLPKTFSEAGQKLLRELARTDPYDPRKSVKW